MKNTFANRRILECISTIISNPRKGLVENFNGNQIKFKTGHIFLGKADGVMNHNFYLLSPKGIKIKNPLSGYYWRASYVIGYIETGNKTFFQNNECGIKDLATWQKENPDHIK